MKKKSILFGAFGIVAILAAFGVVAVVWMMGQPLYKFGSVNSAENLRGPLQPPEQTGESVWQVESDIGLHFDAYGEGRPVLVIHGGPGIPYASKWKGLDALTDRFKFYYYHQRGCGDSSRPFDRFESGNFYKNMTELEKTLGLGAQIADIERIRRILGQEKITLIGHSFGGFIAALYAAEFPGRVDKLLLVAPAGVLTPPDEDRDLFDRVRKKLPEDQHVAYDSLLADYFDFGNIFSRSDADLVSLHDRTGQYILPALGYDPSELEKGPTSGGWAVFAMYFSLGTSQDYTLAMQHVTAATLIVHGGDDGISLPGSRTYERWIPGAKFMSLSREESERHAGHFVFDDCPNKFAAVAERFLSTD